MSIDKLAQQDFERAIFKAFRRKILAWLTGENNALLPFDEVRQHLPIRGQHYRGIQQVPIEQIVGSVGRYRDFDRAFLPQQARTRDRWVNIDKAHLQQVNLPPVELFKIGEAYFVKDGNHRVSVARERGQEFIDAVVIEVDVPVPISPGIKIDDLALTREYAAFVEQTSLSRIRPGARFETRLPGQFEKLREHVDFHRWLLSEQRGSEVPWEEAAASWYDNVYWPLIEAIRKQGVLKAFPDLAETDLYLWVVKYQWYLRCAYKEENGVEEVVPAEAKAEAARQLIEAEPQPLARRLAGVLKSAHWMDDLTLRQERAEFFSRTHLDSLRPAARIEATLPGQYNRLLDHIAAHRWYMGEQRQADVAYDEAAASWYDHAYWPFVQIIREQHILDEFPGRTETDLYLWIIEYQEALREEYGEDVSLAEAAGQFAEAKGDK
jgi:hypothetical protein